MITGYKPSYTRPCGRAILASTSHSDVDTNWNSCSLKQLSTDILRHICSFLSIQGACRMEQTCRTVLGLMKEKKWFWDNFLDTVFIRPFMAVNIRVDNPKSLIEDLYFSLRAQNLYHLLKDVPIASTIDRVDEIPQNVLTSSDCQDTFCAMTIAYASVSPQIIGQALQQVR
jgi:hypothetical protein